MILYPVGDEVGGDAVDCSGGNEDYVVPEICYCNNNKSVCDSIVEYSPFKHHRPTDTTLDSFVTYCFESVSQKNVSCYSSENYPDTRLLPLYRA